MRILVVEDEVRLAANIARSMRESCHFVVDVAADGQEGRALAQTNAYDAIVLDLMLPTLDGRSVLQKLREQGNRVPVLILTARDEKVLVSTLLNEGADDYLTKPFDLGELLARVRALIRRSQGAAQPILRCGMLELNTATRTVGFRGVALDLTPTEYRLLEYLLYRSPAVVSKTELSEHLYDYNWESFSNVIEVHISALRKKLETASRKQVVQTVRGHGYVVRP